jgi:hypothetical protein
MFAVDITFIRMFFAEIRVWLRSPLFVGSITMKSHLFDHVSSKKIIKHHKKSSKITFFPTFSTVLSHVFHSKARLCLAGRGCRIRICLGLGLSSLGWLMVMVMVNG